MCPTHYADQCCQGKEDPNQRHNEQYYANGEEQYCGEEQEQHCEEGQAECEKQYQVETGGQEEEQPMDAHWLEEFGI